MGVLNTKRCAVVLACALLATLLNGCAWLRGAQPAPGVVAPPARMEATRAMLLVNLEQNAIQIQSLTANAQAWAYNESVVLPATMADNVRMKAGKEYDKKFERGQVNAALKMKRGEGGMRNIYLSGTVVGLDMNLKLIGQNDTFWMSLPAVTREQAPDKRGVIYVGVSQRIAPRRADIFSIRPQDVWDLLFTDEVLIPDILTYMETWPDFYVINFLRPDSPERIFSKVWFSREDLTMTAHQIFDGTGRIIAEARFKNYEVVETRKPKGRVLLPAQVMLLWPRDRLMLTVELTNMTVNEDVLDKWFEAPKDMHGYRVQRIDDIPVPAAPSGTTAP